MSDPATAPLFLGLDSSTQSLKATLLDEQFQIVKEATLNFDRDLPEFETEGGAVRGADGVTVTSPTIMWVAALDLLFARMADEKWPLERIVCVSGSGQQHGSVWFQEGARETLQSLDPACTLREQLSDCFAIADSPIWMDSSTTAECEALELALGGAQAVAELTGSRAFERFTGNQIAKLARTNPEGYAATERISLVSSFVASLLIGDYAPIDLSDGSGMNLLDIRQHDWSTAALEATSPALAERLGVPIASHESIGVMDCYFCARYGFNTGCRVIAFSGDNPNSLAGLRIAEPGDLALSLGTSMTIFGSLSEPTPSAHEGHIFVNPVDPAAYMAMLCVKNGTLTVERIRDRVAAADWGRFAELMAASPVGNSGHIGFYFDDPEITPNVPTSGHARFGPDDAKVDQFAAEVEVRAVLEGQFLSMRLHGEKIGLVPTRILATGGASKDATVIRIMADVFGCPVFVAEQTDSASLGAAYRAMHGWRSLEAGALVSFGEMMAEAPAFRQVADADDQAHAVYSAMLPRFAALESTLL
jgi:xylulokinase